MLQGRANRMTGEPGIVVSPARSSAPFFARIAQNISILTVPSIATAVTLIIAWQWREQPFPLFDGVLAPANSPDIHPSNWLSWGHAAVPVVFLITNLVNRRFGEGYALAHVLVSSAIAAAVTLAVMAGYVSLSPPYVHAPPLRVASSFFAALVLGQLAGVYVFDRTRGVAWWNAPAYGALTSSFVAMPLFYCVAYIGTGWDWVHHLSIDLGLKSLASFALLIPYFLLRRIVPPRPGLGGF